MKKSLILNENKNKFELENFKTLRSNLLYQSDKLNKNAFIITSSVNGEGKSFVTANLAVLCAKANKKVLVIDTDMQNGIQHEIFEIKNNYGLSDCIYKIQENENAYNGINQYINKTKYKDLDILTAGKKIENSAEFLESIDFDKLIESVKNNYDLILIDTKALGLFSNALTIAKNIKEIVLVVEMNKIEPTVLKNTKQLIENIDANIVGYVVNKMPKDRINEYYKYFTSNNKSKKEYIKL